MDPFISNTTILKKNIRWMLAASRDYREKDHANPPFSDVCTTKDNQIM
jgi:hypothetical protein